MSPGGLVALGWFVGALCQITPDRSVDLHDDAVHIADVATLECVAPDKQQGVGGLVIARMPSGVQSLDLTSSALADLVHRRAPGVKIAAEPDPRSVQLRAPALPEKTSARQTPCFAAARPIRAGRLVLAEGLTPAECASTPVQLLRFDRSAGLVRAETDIPAGAYLGHIAVPSRAVADTGDNVSLAISVGPVRIERDVRAMQPVRDGERAFIRDAEGEVFAAPVNLDDRRTTP